MIDGFVCLMIVVTPLAILLVVAGILADRSLKKKGVKLDEVDSEDTDLPRQTGVIYRS